MGATTEIPVVLPHLGHAGAMVIMDVTTSTEQIQQQQQQQQQEEQQQHHYHNNNQNNVAATTTTTTQGLLVEVMEQQHDSSTNDHNDYYHNKDEDDNNANNNNKTLVSIIFILFVIFGTGNAVLGKLVMIPMYNYPVFLNLWICILYCLICFIYVVPAWYYKYIPSEQFALPKLPFAIMAIFDTIFGILVMLSATYLPGPLLVLLAQATIPFSMVFSKLLLKTSYKVTHYIGAIIVIIGIIIVLEPLFSKRHLSNSNICIANDEYIDDFCILCENQFTKDNCLSFKVQRPVNPSSLTMFDDNDTKTTTSSSSSSSIRILSSLSLEKEEQQQPSLSTTTTTTSACIWESEGTTESNVDGSNSTSMIMWSFIMILSTIPLTLSSIYKEQYNSIVEIDPIYINFWIGLYQTIYSIPLSIPAGYISSPSISYDKLYENFVGGFKCFIGIPTITTGCHPDINCQLWGPLATIGFFVVNTAYIY